MIQKIKAWNPIIGDDEPYNTTYYRDVPNGFRIENLTIDADAYPLLYANWDRFVDIADKYYRNCEINGETIKDFFENLELSLELGKDKLEKILSNLDYLVFEHGNETTRELSEDSSIDEDITRTGTNSDNETVNITDKNVELAFNSANDDASNKVIKSGTDNISHGINESESKDTSTDRGLTETITVTRYQGETGLNFFEQLINVYPDIPMMFINMFKEDFIIKEVIIW